MKKLFSTILVGVFSFSAFAAAPAATATPANDKPAMTETKTPVQAKKDKATHASKKHKKVAPAAASTVPAVK